MFLDYSLAENCGKLKLHNSYFKMSEKPLFAHYEYQGHAFLSNVPSFLSTHCWESWIGSLSLEKRLVFSQHDMTALTIWKELFLYKITLEYTGDQNQMTYD